MILPHAHQDGPVTKVLENALWLTQEMDLEVNQLVKITAVADHTQVQAETLIDATLLTIFARRVKRETLDAAQIEQQHVATAKIQIPLTIYLSAIELTQINQSARNVIRIKQAVRQEVKLATAALLSHNFSNVIQKH
jgi:DUF1365 family protein